MKFKKYDVIIVGSGIAGLYTALELDKNLQVLVLSKNKLEVCNTALAQGGVAAVLDDENDNFDLHISDTMIAGGFKNDIDAVRILVQQGPENVLNLVNYGVDFDRDSRDKISLGLEGGHSRNRIAHHKDTTGFEILTSLINAVQALPNVTMLENAHLLGLMKEGEDFLANVFSNNEHLYYTTKHCVLATGGIGRIYNLTTNSAAATGDGIYFAYTMGADIKNLSYIQFHPTAFADKSHQECFLISEAVRGEGAYLLNCHHERFMPTYEPERKELAPRNVVSQCIMREQEKTGSDKFYIDISHKDPNFIKNRFPMIYKRILEMGYDITKEPVPIYPCQHYLMGGIVVDNTGHTTVSELYATGECANTGVHGINRLASNSLLEALVFSKRIADDINSKIIKFKDYSEVEFEYYPEPDGNPIPLAILEEVRGILQKSFFVIPNLENCFEGFKRVMEIKNLLEIGKYTVTPEFTEMKAITTSAYIILDEVLKEFKKRKEQTMRLPKIYTDEIIKTALKEDINYIDVATDYLIDENHSSDAYMVAKADGVLCGVEISCDVFKMLDEKVKIEFFKKDGETIKSGDIILKLSGKTSQLLKGERTALNILQHLSGIATYTNKCVLLVEGTNAIITETRKTLPGLRPLQKYAVVCGGGRNHRFNLSDAAMLKDNHIDAYGGIIPAVTELKKKIGHTVNIEVEVRSLDELNQALECGVDIIMLDNMDNDTMRRAVQITNKKAKLEASGNITLENIRSVAETGVDIISLGALTHSVQAFDISMKWQK